MTGPANAGGREQNLGALQSEAARSATESFWKTASAMRFVTDGVILDSTDLIRKARDER